MISICKMKNDMEQKWNKNGTNMEVMLSRMLKEYGKDMEQM